MVPPVRELTQERYEPPGAGQQQNALLVAVGAICTIQQSGTGNYWKECTSGFHWWVAAKSQTIEQNAFYEFIKESCVNQCLKYYETTIFNE